MSDIVTPSEALILDGPTAVTIGKLDGVHLGHRALIQATRAAADHLDGRSLVMTFWPHPLRVLRPTARVPLLNSREDRLDLLAHAGPDHVEVIPFDEEFARRTADDFLAELRDRLGMAVLVVGREARMGTGRHAGVDELSEIGRRLGFDLQVVDPVIVGQRVSSQMVRDLIELPDLERGVESLGRLPSYAGRVARGDRRGRELGFPTANLEIEPDRVVPARGVYAGRVLVSGEDRALQRAVINLGTRPTFGDGRQLLEAHLLDFDGDLYDRSVRVYFEQYLRPERRFAGVAELKEQIDADIAAALASPPAFPAEFYAPWAG
ncbi:MAG: riboflavin biosynthesis protein RibF [Chloroflexota bacterium]|nr:riboflavin biosynthesis protein RibF [Chloroflexota bacterium]MDP6509391.1 riboflavin biosynthesis protein RibF [Chloroflexota bacterium]MDP6757445.1 riboflavin biosynthesis protein RibF [Chloroflexota bacterium]